jgi:thioredoxin reductase
VTGLPLIKNAIAQGARAADAVHKSLAGAGSRPGAALDLIIVGAGPAGLSAALRAQELGVTFEVIEQGSVAQSIRSFPRGKLVFDQPLELPVAGQLWLEESTKEELLSHWIRIVRRERLPIVEDTRVVDVARAEAGFSVTTEPREGGARTEKRARRVVLAIGQRGTPRRLPFEIEPHLESRVHYHLFDAKSFERQKVVVVGLGDVAMEAVIALARQPGTEVTVLHRAPSFSRGKSRNIAEVKRLATSGRINLRFGTEVAAVRADALDVCAAGATASIAWDALLVLIGSIPPWATLRSFGVRSHADANRREDPSESPSVDAPSAPA